MTNTSCYYHELFSGIGFTVMEKRKAKHETEESSDDQPTSKVPRTETRSDINVEELNVTHWFGQNDLFNAVLQGNLKVVQTILSCREENANITDAFGQTALFAAVRQDNVEVVQTLLSHGVDVSVADEEGQTALFAAAEVGNVEGVQVLLSHGVNVTNQLGQTALFAAARSGNVEVVQTLLIHDVDVNVTDQEGQTALFAAAGMGNVEVVQAFLSHGVNVNVTDQQGQTALFTAARQGTDKLGLTALFAAAARVCNVEVVQALLSHGVDVNVTDKWGETALFAAARVRNVEVVQALLSHGVNVTDEEGQTALFAAVEVGNVEVVQDLLSHGVDVNVTDEEGHTALFIAASESNIEVVEALLSHGVDVNVTDQWGQTALFIAASESNIEVVEALLSHGVDVNVTDREGHTALFSACGSFACFDIFPWLDNAKDFQNGMIEIVDSLVKHGANPSAVDNTGNSALFYTAELALNGVFSNDVIQIIKLLMTHGASADARNAAGETLLLHYLSFTRGAHSFSYLWMKQIVGSLTVVHDVCQFLIESEVDINVRTHSGHSVIHLVLLLLRHILEQETKESWDVFMEKIESSLNLLKLIPSILSCSSCSKSMAGSRVDDDGNTPLHFWASLPALKQSIAQNDNPSTTNTASFLYPSIFHEEYSPADAVSHLEAILSHVATQLISHGAKVNAANGDGETPLHMAQTWNAAKFLLDKGALPNARDLHGNTPLLCNVQCMVLNHRSHPLFFDRFHEVFNNMETDSAKMQWQAILNSGMDPWEGNDEGTTVLALLLQADAFDLVRAFLEATGAPYGQKYPVDGNGDTPLHVICRDSGKDNFWKLNLIDYLVPSGADIVSHVNRKRETALHIVCQRRNDDPLSCEIIQRLRAYGAQVDIADAEGKTCLDIAEDKPELMTLLTQDIKLFETVPWLPWSSKSEKHKDLLAQVARGQNAHQTGSLYYHITPIGSGAFGHVYAGIDSKDGREVAVKRVEKVRMCRPEDRREIKNLLRLTDCEHVVRYLGYHADQDFLYIVLELMEGTLKELLDGEVKEEEEVSLCKDVLNGLTFLHQNNTIHRDIKPGNILYKHNPNLSLKLADFGLSALATSISMHTTTVMHSKAGTRCWMAPELLRAEPHSKASDVFACGLVLHYLLSRKKHPFGPENESGKSDFVIQHETEAKVLNNKLTVDGDLSPEAQDLIKLMVNCNKDDRSSAAEALRHPLFWSNHKKVAFLTAVGNQSEVLSPRHFAYPLSSVEQDLENDLGSQFARNPWDGEVPQIYAEMTLSRKSRKYVTSSAVDLLRFVRNTYAHVGELTEAIKTSVLNDFVFFSKFPTLVMDVYKAVTSHRWDQRKEIACTMNAA